MEQVAGGKTEAGCARVGTKKGMAGFGTLSLVTIKGDQANRQSRITAGPENPQNTTF